MSLKLKPFLPFTLNQRIVTHEVRKQKAPEKVPPVSANGFEATEVKSVFTGPSSDGITLKEIIVLN